MLQDSVFGAILDRFTPMVPEYLPSEKIENLGKLTPKIQEMTLIIRHRPSNRICRGPAISAISQLYVGPAEARRRNPSRVPRWVVRVSCHRQDEGQDTVDPRISNPSGTPPKAHRIGPTPGKSLGIFATRDLDRGDLIYVERPLLVLPSCTNHVDITCPPDWTWEKSMRALMFEWDKECHRAFERLDPVAREAYLSLANIHTEDGSGTTLGICRTNGFRINWLSDTVSDGASTFEASYTGVCKDFSRANHSCCPNITRYFDRQAFAYYFSAMRPIKSGEEMTIGYSVLDNVRSVRQQEYRKYGFDCDCPPAAQISNVNDLDANYVAWLKVRTLPKDEVIKTSRWWIKIIESERLECLPIYGRHLEAIHRAYVALGDKENAIKYGVLLGKWRGAFGELFPPIAWLSDPRGLQKRRDWAIRKA
ncbi:hypothetical protein BD779DRAFT_1700215 [Infundibulicybe gibba]|nr:hypothetical protein BD779DRAFT_1700215 [Infundibulicybe gibba]